jgi:hypothetical protein
MQAIVVEQKEAAVAAIEVVEPVVFGCKLDVWKGRAAQTRGGLRKVDLKLNRIGTVVSIKASAAAKRNGNLGKFLFSTEQKEPCPPE